MPHFRLIANGCGGSTSVDITQDSPVMDTFLCTEPVHNRSVVLVIFFHADPLRFSYKTQFFQYIVRALSIASKLSLRIDAAGILCAQFLIYTEKDKPSLVEYFVSVAERVLRFDLHEDLLFSLDLTKTWVNTRNPTDQMMQWSSKINCTNRDLFNEIKVSNREMEDREERICCFPRREGDRLPDGCDLERCVWQRGNARIRESDDFLSRPISHWNLVPRVRSSLGTWDSFVIPEDLRLSRWCSTELSELRG